MRNPYETSSNEHILTMLVGLATALVTKEAFMAVVVLGRHVYVVLNVT